MSAGAVLYFGALNYTAITAFLVQQSNQFFSKGQNKVEQVVSKRDSTSKVEKVVIR